MTMKYWKIKLTCLTPTYIGGGEVYSKNQYIYDKRQQLAYFLNESRWAQFLNRKNLISNFTQELMYRGTKLSVYDWLVRACTGRDGMDELLKEMEQEEIISSPIVVEAEGNEQINDVQRFIHDGAGAYYIPGSSLKGAFRTAILAHEVTMHRTKYKTYWNEIISNPTKYNIGRQVENLEREMAIPGGIRGKLTDSYFKGLIISDATLAECHIGIAKKLDLGTSAAEKNEDPHGVALYRECLTKGTTAYFSVGIDAALMGRFGIQQWADLLQAVQTFTDFQKTLLIPAFQKWSQGKLEVMDSADVVLGGGAGFLSKTLLYSLAPDRQSGIQVVRKLLSEEFGSKREPDRHKHLRDSVLSPHTLKLTDWNGNYHIMGLCQVKILEEES